MADVTGGVRLTTGGKEYRLHMGTSVLAAMQGLHGQDVLGKMERPDGAPASWMPDLQIVHDLFRLSLERYHGEVDRYTIDDMIEENENSFGRLMNRSMPDPVPAGKAPAPARRRR